MENILEIINKIERRRNDEIEKRLKRRDEYDKQFKWIEEKLYMEQRDYRSDSYKIYKSFVINEIVIGSKLAKIITDGMTNVEKKYCLNETFC